MKVIRHLLTVLLVLILARPSAEAQTGAPLRRPISPNQPSWFIHIDTWNHADPQKIIDLVPPDIRPYVVFNISVSINHDAATGKWLQTEYGYEVAKSWLRICAENRVWAMIQQSSGGFQHFSETDLAVYEEFYREYPNFIGFNYAEQFWGYDGRATDSRSPNWVDRIALFARLLELSNQYGGYLVVSWCGNQWDANINPVAMLKRIPAFELASRNYTKNYILCEKYTQQSYQFDMESTSLGAYLSGYAGQYGIRYDSTGWSDADGNNENFTLSTGGAPQLEHAMLTGQTVIDGPETIPTQASREIGTTTLADGFTTRRWEFYPQCINVNLDIFRKILDGTVRIPTRQEVIDRTKVVIINNVNSGSNQDRYSSPQTLYEGLYRPDLDGNWELNKSFFKKTGRYPTIPVVYQLADSAANSFTTKVNKSAYATRWPNVSTKATEFNSLFPQEYTGDIYAGRHENGWVVYNPYKTGQTASGVIPFKYNTASQMELTLSQYTSGVVKETADKVTFYLNNYDNVIGTALKTDIIKIHGASSEPTWSHVNRGNSQALTPVVTKDWSAGVLTLTVQHNGPLDLTVNCAGSATGRLTAYTPAALTPPTAPPAYPGLRQHEGENFDYRSINGVTANAVNGSIRNYTGQGFLRFGTNSQARIRKSVKVLNRGTYRLETRYSVEGGNVNSIDLYVNGNRVSTPAFIQTPSFSDWAVSKQNVTLSAGTNSIEFRATATAAYSVYFDNVVVASTSFENGLVIQENGDGFGSVDGSIDSSPAGFTGTGFANTTDAPGTGIDWWLDLPAATTGGFTFRYASLEDRLADLYVNGVKVASNILFRSTGSLSSWDFVPVYAPVPSGLCQVRLQATSPSGLPNVDYLGVVGEAASGTISPQADVYVRDGGNAATNFGTSDQLVTKNDGGANSGFNRVTYLKFDVSGMANAQSVKLKLVPFQVDSGTATLNYERIPDDSWSESATTWNNRPTAAGTLIANTGSYVVGQQSELDLTSIAKNEAAGDGTLSLRISNPATGNNFVGFHSKESASTAFRPVLDYTVAVPSVRPGAVKAAYLRFDESSGNLAEDSTGNGWNGTLSGNPTRVSGPQARINRALALGGGSHVTLPAALLGGFEDFTISFWLKPDSLSANAPVFDFGSGSTNHMYFTPATAEGTTRFAIQVNGSLQAVEAPAQAGFQAGTWTHAAITLSGSTARLYLNGTEVASNTAMTHRPADLGVTTANFLGKPASPDHPYLAGTLDDFRIYRGALAPLDIARVAAYLPPPTNPVASASSSRVTLTWNAVPGATSYTIRRATSPDGPYLLAGTPIGNSFVDTSVTDGTTYYYTITAGNGMAESSTAAAPPVVPGPVRLHLRMDEATGTTAADASGRGWHGTLANGPTWVSGANARLGGAINLPGSNQHIVLPAGLVGDVNECTIAFWLRLGSINTWARVFDFNNGSTASSMYFVPRTAGGVIRFGINGQNLEAPAATQFAVNTWTHVAITLSGSTGTIYLDGIPVATSNTMTNKPSALGLTPLNYIGRSASAADPYLNGRVDEFLIYEVALGAGQIASLAAVPAAPAGLTATVEGQSVSLAWAPLNGATAYQVQRSLTNDGPYTTIASLPGSAAAFIDSSVASATTYYYVVAISGGAGLGSKSQQASASTPATPPVIGSASTATGSTGSPFAYQIAASDGPSAFTAGGLPPGLTVDQASGLISGTPEASGVFTVTIGAENAAGSGSATLTLTIVSPPIISDELRAPALLLFGGDASITTTISVTGHLYQLQHRDDLATGTWQNHGEPKPGTGGPLNFLIPVDPEASRRFYRLLILQP